MDASLLLKEALDLAMVTAAFGQSVALLFEGKGVLQLLPDQQPEAVGVKHYAKALQALALYDINDVYLCEASAEQYGVSSDALMCPAKRIDLEARLDLLHRSDLIFDYPAQG